MAAWAPAIVTGLFSLLGIALTYGMLTQRVSDNTRDIAKLEHIQEQLFSKANSTAELLANTRGQLGLNGAERAKGANA